MQKDQAYHESAIAYNEGLAEYAENLATTLEHEEVKRWCTAVGKQHRFHAKRHRNALNKLLLKQAAPPVETVMDGMDVPPQGEPNVVREEAVEEEVTVLEDGCSPFHNPTRPECQFYPQAGE
jgi:hypothetical protein